VSVSPRSCASLTFLPCEPDWSAESAPRSGGSDAGCGRSGGADIRHPRRSRPGPPERYRRQGGAWPGSASGSMFGLLRPAALDSCCSGRSRSSSPWTSLASRATPTPADQVDVRGLWRPLRRVRSSGSWRLWPTGSCQSAPGAEALGSTGWGRGGRRVLDRSGVSSPRWNWAPAAPDVGGCLDRVRGGAASPASVGCGAGALVGRRFLRHWSGDGGDDDRSVWSGGAGGVAGVVAR
jgi:hypothetical protein